MSREYGSVTGDGAGRLWIISAPSGAGKTTLVKSLVRDVPDLLVSVSHTTRPRRTGEQDGVDYHFVTDAEFDRMVEENRFLEHARVFDYSYGTSRDWVTQQLAGGRDVILEIDWQGARQIRELMPRTTGIFILPPAFDVLEQRLTRRGDAPDVIRRRIRGAAQEIAHCGEFEHVIVNERVESALAELEAIVAGARRGEPVPGKTHPELAAALLEQARKIQ